MLWVEFPFSSLVRNWTKCFTRKYVGNVIALTVGRTRMSILWIFRRPYSQGGKDELDEKILFIVSSPKFFAFLKIRLVSKLCSSSSLPKFPFSFYKKTEYKKRYLFLFSKSLFPLIFNLPKFHILLCAFLRQIYNSNALGMWNRK